MEPTANRDRVLRSGERRLEPTERQATIIGMWVCEATMDEILLACAEEAYTLRELIRAIHRTGNADTYPVRNRELNRLAEGA